MLTPPMAFSDRTANYEKIAGGPG